ncbi:MAG: hypothetical protein ACON39_07910 [Coraliomargaritaceae bacterium]
MNKTKLFLLAVAFAAINSAQAEWKFGIGAGAGAFDIDGDLTLADNSGDLEFDSGDMESAISLQGYAATGAWIFRASVFSFEVEADQTPTPGVVLQDVNFEQTILDLTAGYKWVEDGAWTITTYAGLRSVSQEMTGPAITGDFDNTWTDGILGSSATYALNEKWFWSSALEAGFGGSEGVFGANTGITWRFAMDWSASAILSWSAAEYEEGDAGDADHYLYDANLTKLGLGIVYHF